MKAALTFLFSLTLTFSFAQDPFFTQYNYGWAMVNPAYAGSLACARAEVGYRMQWVGFDGAPRTFNAAYDQYTKYGGIGLNYTRDDIGLMETDRVDFNYSYPLHINITKSESGFNIQPGLQFSYYQKRIDTAGLLFLGPVETFDHVKRNVFDVSAGLLIYCKRVSFGAAVFHLTEPEEGFLGTSNLPQRFVINAAGIFGNADPDDKGVSVIPSILLMRQANFFMGVGMINVKFSGVNLGIGYRNEDALLFSAAYTWRDITLAYSYDYTISNLAYYSNGTHEVHARYCFMKNKWSEARNLRQFM